MTFNFLFFIILVIFITFPFHCFIFACQTFLIFTVFITFLGFSLLFFFHGPYIFLLFFIVQSLLLFPVLLFAFPCFSFLLPLFFDFVEISLRFFKASLGCSLLSFSVLNFILAFLPFVFTVLCFFSLSYTFLLFCTSPCFFFYPFL